MTRTCSALRIFALLLILSTARGSQAADAPPPSSEPRNLYVFQNFVYCSADDGLHGRELWRVNLDGVHELVKDITPGSEGSDIFGFGGVGNVLYFGVNTPRSGGELWRTDGTGPGTSRVKLFEFGLKHGFKNICGDLRGEVVIQVEEYAIPNLWLTDGTEAGTRPFQLDGADTPYSNNMGRAFLLDGFMFFSAELKESGFGVFRSDGTPEGTVLLCDTVDRIDEFFSLDGRSVLFQRETPERGFELWTTEGTPDTTGLFLDLDPDSEQGGGTSFQRVDYGADPPLAIFSAGSLKAGLELWVTDGTPGGTTMLPEIIPGEGSAMPGHLMGGHRWAIFSATSPEHGKEVWRVNPRTRVVERLTDLSPGPAGGDPYAFCLLNGTIAVFSGNNPEFGEELWAADNDSGRVKLLNDVYSGPESAYPYHTVEMNGAIIFAATDDAHGRELWVTDGVNRPRLLADIYADDSINPSSFPKELTAVGPILYFVANDIAHGFELWRTDGTPGGTRLVKDLFPGRTSSDPRELTVAGEWLYFTADDGLKGERLWRSDGTEAGTVVADDAVLAPQELTVFNGAVYCSAVAANRNNGRELWCQRYLGRGGQVKDIAEGALSSDPHNLVVAGDYLYFSANDGIHGVEIWRTNGSEESTVMVRDLVEAPFEPMSAGKITGAGGRIFFAGDTPSQGIELWSFDPETLAIGLVLDTAPVDAVLLLHGENAGDR